MQIRPSKRSAFTLMEVMVVVAILVIISAIAYPSMDGFRDRMRLDGSVDQIRGKWGECRAHAIEEGRSYRFAVKAGTNQYRVAPDAAEFWDGGGDAAATGSDIQPLILEEEIEKDVLFQFTEGSGGAESGGWTTVVVFRPIGECKADAEVKFQLEGMKPVTLRVRALTGVVTTVRGEQE